jgi:hypothetical protein
MDGDCLKVVPVHGSSIVLLDAMAYGFILKRR